MGSFNKGNRLPLDYRSKLTHLYYMVYIMITKLFLKRAKQ